ncbi:maleylacetoacetate isomerase [bacterium]|nr:maleylacetoacetate isomerase [bacterium]
MSDPILYGYWRSSASYRVRIALNLKGVAYRSVSVDLRKGGQTSEAHRARHPSARVPVLEIDGVTLAQSMAIVDYLDETRPDPPLLPASAVDRARVRDIVGQIAADIHPLNNLAVLARLRSQFAADDAAVAEWYRHWVIRGFEVLEQMLPSSGGVCFGDQVTVADIALAPQVANARRFDVRVEDYPNIARIDAALLKRKPFADAAPENQPEATSA